MNNGSGGFSATGSAIGSETDNTVRVVLGDVDNDGDLDLVSGNINQTNKLYHGLFRGVYHLTSGQQVVSLTVNTGESVTTATLIASDEANTATTRNTSIAYSLSNDGGVHWYRVPPGKGVVFPSAGTDVRWKAEFHSLTPARTSLLHQVIIDLDNDSDGIGDSTDLDHDNDGISDLVENQIGTDPLVFDDQTQPLVDTGIDSDGDGLSDDYEINVSGTDPNVANTVYTGTLPGLGDMNADGDINLGDLLLLQRQILGL